MGKDKNLEQNLDKSNEKLHISGVIDSISFNNVDFDLYNKKIGLLDISVDGIIVSELTYKESQNLFNFLKKYFQ